MQDNSHTGAAHILPDAGSRASKTEQVAGMFDGIAKRYDFLNHFLSLGIDKGWRKKAIAQVIANNPKSILDVATGTGDLAIAAAKAAPTAAIQGVDISEGMMAVGREKLSALGLRIPLQYGDSEHLPFADATFDAVMCAYGVRNFEHLEASLRDMRRVMTPGGRLVILEFSNPQRFPVKQAFGFYSKYLLPLFGRLVSKHSRAYTYLPETVAVFPEGKDFTAILERCGFTKATARPLTFGITTLYTAVK